VSGSQEGQASLELLGGAIALFLTGLLALQLLGAGYAAVMADHAAEAAALALANGRPARPAAREAVPGWPEGAISVQARGGDVRVRLRPPSPLRFLRERLQVDGSAALPELDGQER
jgi:hypothetical protein